MHVLSGGTRDFLPSSAQVGTSESQALRGEMAMEQHAQHRTYTQHITFGPENTVWTMGMDIDRYAVNTRLLMDLEKIVA